MLRTEATVMSAAPEACKSPISMSVLLPGYAFSQCLAACSTSSRRWARMRVCFASLLGGSIRSMSRVKITSYSISIEHEVAREGGIQFSQSRSQEISPIFCVHFLGTTERIECIPLDTLEGELLLHAPRAEFFLRRLQACVCKTGERRRIALILLFLLAMLELCACFSSCHS